MDTDYLFEETNRSMRRCLDWLARNHYCDLTRTEMANFVSLLELCRVMREGFEDVAD